MSKFDLRRYNHLLQSAVDSGAVPRAHVEAYRAALEAAQTDSAKALRRITNFGGRVTAIGDDLFEAGIRFVDRETIEAAGARGVGRAASSAARCIGLIAAAAFEVLSNASIADAHEAPTPVDIFYDSFDATIESIRTGHRLNWYFVPFHSDEEIAHIHERFVLLGYLRKMTVNSPSADGTTYEWADDLTEEDLDIINNYIKMDQLFHSLPGAMIEIEGHIGVVGPGVD